MARAALVRRDALRIAAFGVVYALVGSLATNSYHQLILTVVPVWAVMGLAWNILSGYGGLVSFGHAAFFGLGDYPVALGQIRWGLSPWLGIPLAGLLGGAAGLLVGILTFRLRGHYFALAMLAYPLALLYVFEWLGYQELSLPMMRDAPRARLQFDDQCSYMFLALGLMLLAMLLTSLIERSRFGRCLLAIKQDEAAAEAAGIRTMTWKLRAIAVSGALAGAAGGYYAVVLLVVTPPAVFGMLVSAPALIVTMFGGVGMLWGPVLGATILVPLSEILHARLGNIVPGIQGVVYGVAIVAVTLLAPEGVYWRLRDALARRTQREPVAAATARVSAPAETSRARPQGLGALVVLDVRAVSRAFGGLQALKSVSLQVHQGEILGIIGPNGAGKTTLFNLLNGFVRPDSGQVLFEGRDLAGSRPSVVCAAEIGRTFQMVRPFARMSVLENVIIGAYVRSASDAEAEAAARLAIEQVGLSGISSRLAAGLTTRESRLLELARALAGGPKLLFLDETLAGLAAEDAEAVVDVVRALAGRGITVVIIEHTMQAIWSA